MKPITTVYTGDLTEEQKKEIIDQLENAQMEYFINTWEGAVDPGDRAQMTFDFTSYKDEPVYQFYERLIETIKNN